MLEDDEYNVQSISESSRKDAIDKVECKNWRMDVMINSGSEELRRARAELDQRCADV